MAKAPASRRAFSSLKGDRRTVLFVPSPCTGERKRGITYNDARYGNVDSNDNQLGEKQWHA